MSMKLYSYTLGNYRIEAFAQHCDDLDLSWDETGEVAAQLDSGEMWAFNVEVRATHVPSGITGADYLGGNIYHDATDFVREFGGYFSDMRREALRQLRSEIHRVKAELPTLNVRG